MDIAKILPYWFQVNEKYVQLTIVKIRIWKRLKRARYNLVSTPNDVVSNVTGKKKSSFWYNVWSFASLSKYQTKELYWLRCELHWEI